MTITQLKYLIAVSEAKNFTKAAELCFVTQPTLSMQILKLEEELEVQIFDRTKKPLRVTEIGETIINQARKIVSESGRLQDVVDQAKGFIGGEFRLGIIPTVMPTLLPMFLKTFLIKYKNVELKISEQKTDELIKNLNEGKLDAAIAATPLNNESLKERVLYFEPFMVYLNENNSLINNKKIKIDDLDNQSILLLKDGHCFKNSILNLCDLSQNKNLNFNIESGNFQTLLHLSNEGLGLTFIPYLSSLNLPDKFKNQLKYFEDPLPSREISLITHKSDLKSQISLVLFDVIKSVLRGAVNFQDIKIISPL